MTSEKSSGFESRLTRRMRPSASSRWNRCTTSTTCVTSRSRPCALAESVPPTVKMFEDCMTLTARPCDAMARCTSSQVAPLSTVTVGAAGGAAESIATMWLNVRMSSHIVAIRSEEHTSELQSLAYLVCRLLLEKKKK